MRKTAILTAVIIGIIATSLTISLQASGQNYNIPTWIKNNAKWWSEGQIGDSDFISGIKYLIENNIMQIELPPPERPFEELWFQTIYLTSEDWCTDQNYNEMMFYNEVADEYLLNYGYSPVSHAPTCLSIQGQGDEELNNIYPDVDLFIIIRDVWHGYPTLAIAQHVWGYYVPLGEGQHLIDICACTVEIESQWGIWLLTHELTHFAIEDNQYPEEMHEGYVHAIQAEKDECDDYYGSECTFTEQSDDFLDERGIRYDVMPYITQEDVDSFS